MYTIGSILGVDEVKRKSNTSFRLPCWKSPFRTRMMIPTGSGQTGIIVAYSHEHHNGIVIILQKSALSILLSHNITGGESIILQRVLMLILNRILFNEL